MPPHATGRAVGQAQPDRAHEQVPAVAQMLRTPVGTAEALAQVALERDRVQQCLQAVAAGAHRRLQRRRGVVLERRARAAAEAVALVVEHVEAPAVGEHQVDLAVHQPGQHLLARGHQVRLAVRGAGRAQRAQGHAVQQVVELHLGAQVGRAQRAQARAVRIAQRRVQHRLQALRQRRGQPLQRALARAHAVLAQRGQRGVRCDWLARHAMLEQRMHGVAEVGASHAHQRVQRRMPGRFDRRVAHRFDHRLDLRIALRDRHRRLRAGLGLRRQRLVLGGPRFFGDAMATASGQRAEAVPQRQRAGRWRRQGARRAQAGVGRRCPVFDDLRRLPARAAGDALALRARLQRGQVERVQRHLLQLRARRMRRRQREHMAGVDGAGQRHVQHAEALLVLLACDQVLRRPFHQHLHAGRGVGQQRRAPPPIAGGAVLPQQRQEHHAELQALAGMQGHQLHSLGIRFQPQRARLGCIAGIALALHLVGEPGQQPLAAAIEFPRRL